MTQLGRKFEGIVRVPALAEMEETAELFTVLTLREDITRNWILCTLSRLMTL